MEEVGPARVPNVPPKTSLARPWGLKPLGPNDPSAQTPASPSTLKEALQTFERNRQMLRKRVLQRRKNRKKNKENPLYHRPSFLIIPKGKRVAAKVVAKLERENYHYIIARAVDAASRIAAKQKAKTRLRPKVKDPGETEWMEMQRETNTYKQWKEGKTKRLIDRERKRRKRRAEELKEELRRKKYRIHPNDQYHIYLEGYQKKRHRISKKRFMHCIDIPLFKEALNRNQELVTSPIWDKNLDLQNLSFVRARILKDHLQQFEVLEEAIKQGIFNKAGCDDLPIDKIRRKRRPHQQKPQPLLPPRPAVDVKTERTKATAEEDQEQRKRWSWRKQRHDSVASWKSSGSGRSHTKKFRDKYKPKEKKPKVKSVVVGRGSEAPRKSGLFDADDVELKKKIMKRRLTYPPYIENVEDKPLVKDVPWLDRVTRWIIKTDETDANQATSQAATKTPDKNAAATPNPQMANQEKTGQRSTGVNGQLENLDMQTGLNLEENSRWKKERKSVSYLHPENITERLTSNLLAPPNMSMMTQGDRKVYPSEHEVNHHLDYEGLTVVVDKPREGGHGSVNRKSDPTNKNPYSDYLTIKVPFELGRRKKFIHNLVERKTKESSRLNPSWMQKKLDRKRYKEVDPMDKYDPMAKLHPDEKESDVWTISTATTTDGYASWRRPPANDTKELDDEKEEEWMETDHGLLWRVLLFFIVLWEASCFVKLRLDDVYYGIFTFHLYRENIWPVKADLVPPFERYWIVPYQEWLHFIISIISMSIIHKENECVSLLFASSLLIDGVVKVALTSHDTLFLPHVVSWGSVALHSLHLIWKAFAICCFIAYHYECADYIRMSREFKHRKTKLHNHEINAKGTKGIQKRSLAWNWMTLHARKSNLRALQKKYPDVKDGNFPEEDLLRDIKFSEAKELRIYAQEHNLNIGYPYNKLRHMKKYVFGELEKSDYSEMEEIENAPRKSAALTVEQWQKWKATEGQRRKEEKKEEEQILEAVSSHKSRRHHRKSKRTLNMKINKYTSNRLSVMPLASIKKLTVE